MTVIRIQQNPSPASDPVISPLAYPTRLKMLSEEGTWDNGISMIV